MSNLKPIIEDSFTQYAGAVLQSRALVDVRDCLKPSARQIFYCLYTDKFLPNKPFKKTLKAIGSIARMYIHGDSSAEGIIMRAGQQFCMRYPLVEVDGNNGNLMQSGNWAASRYTSSRLSNFSVKLFEDIEKNTIAEWRDNYDDTEQYPTVMPSKGYYNIVNGTLGIGIGAASSIPQFNLKEVNEALIKLLWNPDIDFEEIYCAPDFATGAILLNEKEVKNSLKDGYGFACKLRSIIEYDTAERCLIVKEIPFGVYTNTICGELEAILEGDDNPGIDRFNDLTGSTPLIKIYLTRNGKPEKIIKYLYKNTSLQSHYGINMTMLENGRYPKVFGWKEALQAHLNHEKEVYRRGYEFDLKKIKDRLHIVEGLLIALARIEEVIAVIKAASSTAVARENLQKNFLLTDIQAKAILDMKLSRLAHLEVKKLEDEKTSLIEEAEKIEKILNNEELLFKEIEKGYREVADKYGDARRTQILNVENEEDEPIEVKSLLINLTNKNNIFVTESSSLYTQRRGGAGNKFKFKNGEYVLSTIQAESVDTILFFSQAGNFYWYTAGSLPLEEKVAVESLFTMKDNEVICEMTSFNKKNAKENIIFITKNGIIKKSLLEEYNLKRGMGSKALALEEGDEINSIIFTNEEKIGIVSECGQFVMFETKDIRPIGRVTKGIKGIKLNAGDYVASAKTIPANTKELVTVTQNGYILRTDLSEYNITNKNTKGVKIQKLKDEDDCLVDFIPLNSESNLVVVSTGAQIRIPVDQISKYSKGSNGVASIKKPESDKVISLVF